MAFIPTQFNKFIRISDCALLRYKLSSSTTSNLFLTNGKSADLQHKNLTQQYSSGAVIGKQQVIIIAKEKTRLQSQSNCRTVKQNLSICSRNFSVAIKKGKMPKLTESERKEVLSPLLKSGWNLVDGRDAIKKEYIFKNFNEAFSFMTAVALLAEKMDHHPEWFNVYNKVQVTMSTHDVGGLSAKDIIVANFMESQAKKYT